MAVFLQVITLFLLIFCGFFSAKGKLVDENGISHDAAIKNFVQNMVAKYLTPSKLYK